MTQATLQGNPTTVTFPTEATSVTFAVTVASGTETVLAVVVGLESEGTGFGGVSAVTYNGVALVEHAALNNSAWGIAEIWRQNAPTVGTANVVITFSIDKGAAAAYVCNFVDQTTPLRPAAQSTASGTSVTNTVANVAADDLLFDALCIDSTGHATVAGADQTERFELNGGGCTLVSDTQDGGSDGVMSHTWSGAAPYSHVATAFIGSGGAAAPPAGRTLMTMGAGR
jgi:hypothetical protein